MSLLYMLLICTDVSLDTSVIPGALSKYGMATTSKLLKIIGLFCRIKALLQGSLATEPMILRSLLIVAAPYQSLL